MTRFVVDCPTLLRIAAGEIDVPDEHKLVAPALLRSQALAASYEAARRGEITAVEGRERLMRINSLKVASSATGRCSSGRGRSPNSSD